MSLNESSLRKTREGKALFSRNKKDSNFFMGSKAILFLCVTLKICLLLFQSIRHVERSAKISQVLPFTT